MAKERTTKHTRNDIFHRIVEDISNWDEWGLAELYNQLLTDRKHGGCYWDPELKTFIVEEREEDLGEEEEGPTDAN